MKACHSNNRLGGVQIDFENLIDHFFGDVNKSSANKPSAQWVPRTEVLESDAGFQLVIELPGVSKDDVVLEMKENQLIVSGEKKSAEVEEGFHVVRRERETGKFNRSFEFPSLIDAENVSAEFKQGVLMISVPKSAKILPRKIEIATAE